ncbi:MAG: flavin reductase family protein [Nitrospinales bacterium]
MKKKDKIGAAMGRIPSGLFIITARFGDREDGVLASWVNQCSFEPPIISIVLSKVRPIRLLVEGSKAFVLNVLGKDSNGLLKRFSKAPAPDQNIFEGLNTREGYQGITILDEAVSYLECNVVHGIPVGDHVTYFGEIVGGAVLEGGEPYFHTRSSGFSY